MNARSVFHRPRPPAATRKVIAAARSRQSRHLARRLFPVLAFALVLSLVMAGGLGHARSRLAFPPAPHARSAGASPWAINGVLADLSAAGAATPRAHARTHGTAR